VQGQQNTCVMQSPRFPGGALHHGGAHPPGKRKKRTRAAVPPPRRGHCLSFLPEGNKETSHVKDLCPDDACHEAVSLGPEAAATCFLRTSATPFPWHGKSLQPGNHGDSQMTTSTPSPAASLRAPVVTEHSPDEYLPDASHGIFGSLVIRGHNKPALFLSQYRTIPLDNDVC
jgi:hypothetical protein